MKPGNFAEKQHRPDNGAQDILLARHSAGTIRRYIFPKDTILFSKGDMRQCAYLIDKGEVRIFGNDEGGEDRLGLGRGGGCQRADATPETRSTARDPTPRRPPAATARDGTRAERRARRSQRRCPTWPRTDR